MPFDATKVPLPSFLHKKLSKRHFRPHSVRKLLRGGAIGKTVPDHVAEDMVEISGLSVEDLLLRFHTHADGLTEGEAEILRKRFGPNEIQHEQAMTWWAHLWSSYCTPFSLLLTILALISLFTADAKGATVISAMIILSTVMRFVQERRSNASADKLKAMVSNTATVLRRRSDVPPAPPEHPGQAGEHAVAKHLELPIRKLVPGDVVLLSAGDIIPADVRLMSAKDLFVNQSVLTGESLPVEKFAVRQPPGGDTPLETGTLCFLGTSVVSGSATALVIGTGNHTYFGTLATHVTSTDRTPTQFQSGVNKVSWLLLRFMGIMAPIVLLINGFTKGDWVEASLFALSIAVGLTPEMLPLVVTSTLAKGAVVLSRKKVIVKRLEAIQNFGAMNILCTDKTGTLTQGKIEMALHTDPFGAEDAAALGMACLNSRYQTGLKSLLDEAVLSFAETHGPGAASPEYAKVDEIPFDFTRRRMSVVLQDAHGGHLLICKGAVEETLAVCTNVQTDGVTAPLTPESLARIHETTVRMNQEGLRVVAVAVRTVASPQTAYTVADEVNLTLLGYVAFLDPPKESTGPVIQALNRSGIEVKILTGDNDLVSRKVCKEVGLDVKGMLLGHDMDAMDDAALATAAESATLFAKLAPLQKERLVRVLRGRGHVVGFLGDGINDAPALHAADIGISVNSAVDIAKEAADIILLEKSLMVLEAGVAEGRKTFANMLKYIKMTASSNFGNVFSVLIAGAFLPFLPMLPLHLLVQNLLYDVSQAGIPFDNVDEEMLLRPQRWNPDEIGRFMIFFGPTSSVFDILTFLLMWHVFGATTPAQQTLFQSGWFIEGILSQTLIVHLLRTRKIPFFQSRASRTLCAMTATIVALGVFLPMGPLAGYFKLQALPLSYFFWLAGILSGYACLTQLVKTVYDRLYGWQ